MKRQLKLICFTALFLTLTLVWIGCSDDGDKVVSSSGTPSLQYVSTYFPLTSGSALYYRVENSVLGDTLMLNYGIGQPFRSGSSDVYPWYQTNMEFQNQADTGYLYIFENALYYYESASGLHEKILQAPFEIGKSWLRFNTSVIPDITIDDGYSDNDNAKDGQTGDGYTPWTKTNPDGGGALKSFPTVGSNACYITAIEDIDLGDGIAFENCVRVENYSSGSTNYYWYAPNYGLVKYALGVNLQTGDGGTVVGEYSQGTN